MRSKDVASLFISEAIMFIVQLAIIYITGMLTTSFFTDTKSMTHFVLARIGSNVNSEFLITLFSITFILGVIAVIKELADQPLIEHIANEAIFEIPRTIYLFGSATSGASLIFYTAIIAHPSSPMETDKLQPMRFLFIGLIFAALFFLYGFTIKALIIKKRRRKEDATVIKAHNQAADT